MVNKLIGEECPPKVFFHNEAMLQNVLATRRRIDRNITIGGNTLATFPTAFTYCLFQTSTRPCMPADQFSSSDHGHLSALTHTGPHIPVAMLSGKRNHRQSSERLTAQVVSFRAFQTSARSRMSLDEFPIVHYGCRPTVAQAGPAGLLLVVKGDYGQTAKPLSANQVTSGCQPSTIVCITCSHPRSLQRTSVSPGVKTSAVKRYVTGESASASSIVEWGSYPARLHAVTVEQPRAEVKE
jgi:hypothetical protein